LGKQGKGLMAKIWAEDDRVKWVDPDSGVTLRGEVAKAVGRIVTVLAGGLVFYVNRELLEEDDVQAA
jgi:hypothetical protein